MIRPAPSKPGGSLKCATCDFDLLPHDGYCSRCFTPAELSRSIAGRGVAPQFLSVLGASGAGKTVYLGFLLDMLTKGVRNLSGLPNGAFSVGVQQQTMSALQQRRFPAKTSTEADRWHWVHCEITRNSRPKRVVDLVTPDPAGEAIALEVERKGSFETISHVIRKSGALMLLVDSLKVRDSGREQDFFAMKLTSYIRSLHAADGQSSRGRLRMPLAVVFTKADVCWEAQADPQAFARANMPGLVHACERSFASHRFFSTGVVGSLAVLRNEFGTTMQVPLHVEPHGIVEPLEWILKKL